MSLATDKAYMVCRVAQLVERTLEVELKPHKILALIRKKVRSPVRVRPRQQRITLKLRIMKQNHLSEDGEMRYILRQIGFGAVLGIAFLATVFIGGLLAHLVSGL